MKISKDKNYVLITGATSGIGYELAKLYSMEGYNLILIASDVNKLGSVYNELSNDNNIIHTLSVDLSKDGACGEIIKFVDKKKLTVDILINNAGVGSFGYLNDIEIDTELSLININIKAVTEITKEFLSRMIKRNSGAIMNVASTAAFCPGPKMATYYASKAYVLNLTEALYEEVKDKGIIVSCLCPGAVNTSFQSKAGIEKVESAKGNMMTAKRVAAIAYKDFNKGKLIIIPGFKNKIIVCINKFVPRSLSRRIILKMNKG